MSSFFLSGGSPSTSYVWVHVVPLFLASVIVAKISAQPASTENATAFLKPQSMEGAASFRMLTNHNGLPVGTPRKPNCPQGTTDRTFGAAYWWSCVGTQCPGGEPWATKKCKCACVATSYFHVLMASTTTTLTLAPTSSPTSGGGSSSPSGTSGTSGTSGAATSGGAAGSGGGASGGSSASGSTAGSGSTGGTSGTGTGSGAAGGTGGAGQGATGSGASGTGAGSGGGGWGYIVSTSSAPMAMVTSDDSEGGLSTVIIIVICLVPCLACAACLAACIVVPAIQSKTRVAPRWTIKRFSVSASLKRFSVHNMADKAKKRFSRHGKKAAEVPPSGVKQVEEDVTWVQPMKNMGSPRPEFLRQAPKSPRGAKEGTPVLVLASPRDIESFVVPDVSPRGKDVRTVVQNGWIAPSPRSGQPQHQGDATADMMQRKLPPSRTALPPGCRVCEGDCGYVVTWHATHCCPSCIDTNGCRHGANCDKRPVPGQAPRGAQPGLTQTQSAPLRSPRNADSGASPVKGNSARNAGAAGLNIPRINMPGLAIGTMGNCSPRLPGAVVKSSPRGGAKGHERTHSPRPLTRAEADLLN